MEINKGDYVLFNDDNDLYRVHNIIGDFVQTLYFTLHKDQVNQVYRGSSADFANMKLIWSAEK